MPRGNRKRLWEKVIVALLSTTRLDEAAAQAGISVASLDRYLADPEFRALYAQARRRLLDDAVALLQKDCCAAAQTLQRNLTCGKESVEVRAAVAILEQAAKGLMVLDVVAEVERLRSELDALRSAKSASGDRQPPANGQDGGDEAADVVDSGGDAGAGDRSG